MSITSSWSPTKPMSIESVMPSIYLIICCPLLLLPSIFPSIRVFSDESVLPIRWPKYCSFGFNISPSNEHKASGSDGISGELFQILKDDAAKVLHSICQQIWKTQLWPHGWKRSIFIIIPKKGNAKECSNYHTVALISHASKVMLKILQARLQQYVNHELPDVQAGFRKGRGTRNQIANI